MGTVLIFDTESTSVKDPRLVEAAWIQLADGPPSVVPVEKFSSRYNPGRPIECGAMATHHIVDEYVADQPPANGFRLPEDIAFLIGHNVDFDYQVALSCGPQPAPKRICTLALARALWPEADSHGLAALCYLVARRDAMVFCPCAHDAETDVVLCCLLLDKILARLKPATWDELWQASEQARIPTHLSFGKHKGVAIKDAPRDYRDWLLRQPDIDPYLRQAVQESMRR